jgi:uncharacterized membrane protein
MKKAEVSGFSKTRDLVMTGVFAAIIIVQTVVPFLGFIPLGIMNATIIQVTVAIGAVLLGPKKGAFLGFVFGCASMAKNTFLPNATSFVFSPFVNIGGYGGNWRSVIICMVPRILIGIVSYAVFYQFDRRNKRKTGLICGGAAAAVTNTVLVMSGIYFLFGREYAAASGRALNGLALVIMGIVGTQGIPEAIVSAVLTAAIGSALFKVRDNM